MKKSLLFICKFDPFTEYGGAAIRNRSILRILKSAYSVDLLCFATNRRTSNTDGSNISTIAYRPARIRGFFRHFSLSAANFYSPLMKQLVCQQIQSKQYALVFISEVVMFQYVLGLTEAAKLKLVLDSHNVETQLLRDGIPYNQKFKKWLLWVESLLLARFESRARKKSSLVIHVSEVDAQVAGNRFGPPPVGLIIPNCLILPKVQRPVSPLGNSLRKNIGSVTTFVILGTLDWHANRIGIEWFLREIWSPYVTENPAAHLHLIGKKTSKKKFTAPNLVRDYDVVDIATALDTASIAIAPVLYGSGTRLRILEYFLHQKPVIATEKAVEGLGLRADVHYSRVANVHEFAMAVVKLNDLNYRTQLVKNGYEVLKNRFCIDLYRDRLLRALVA